MKLRVPVLVASGVLGCANRSQRRYLPAGLRMFQRVLLACGVLSSLLYIGTDVLGAIRYEGYSYTAQAVSELSAIGAPTRPFVVPLFLAHGVLQIAFGLGVWMLAGRTRGLRITAGLLVGIGLLDLAAYFVPMHLRGAELTLTDTMHVILTSVTVLFILLTIGFGANAFGRRFRLYSIGTIVVLVVGGAFAWMDAARIAANLPTPWIGVTERMNIYGYMLWMAVLAMTLLRVQNTVSRTPLTIERADRITPLARS
jgi:hypothetical protein